MSRMESKKTHNTPELQYKSFCNNFHQQVQISQGHTSPGEERGNETGKVAIAHGSVEFGEATPIGLADES